jgi:Carboxypeptidase regulatory-like domain
VAAVLLAGAVASLLAQSSVHAVFIHTPATGSLSGRLTDLHSGPLAGATVIVRNQATGAETRATTSRNGAYRFASLAPGEYTLEAETPKRGRGRLEGIEVDAGAEAHVQTAMRFEVVPPANTTTLTPGATRPTASEARSNLSTVLPKEPLERMTMANQAPNPSSDSSRAPSAAMAASAPVRPVRQLGATTLSIVKSPGEVHAGPRLTQDAEPASSTKPPAAKPELVLTVPLTNPAVMADVVRAARLTPVLDVSAFVSAETRAAIQLSALALPLIEEAAQEANPDAPAVTTTLTAADLQSLPVSGRNWQEFVLDTPTASTEAGGSEEASLRGTVGQPAGAAVDGVSTSLAFGATGVARPRHGAAAGR